MVSCRECGAQVPDIAGPTHDYVPSAPGCWAAFGQVQADALTRFGSPRRHGTVVDCYMAQHPGDGYERRSRQSPVVHLVALSLLIEHGIEGKGTFVRLARLLERRPNFQPLAPRADRGRLTILNTAKSAPMPRTTRVAPKPGPVRSGERGCTSRTRSGTSSAPCYDRTRHSQHRKSIPLWAGILIGGYLLAKPGMAAREAAATAALQQTQAAAAAWPGCEGQIRSRCCAEPDEAGPWPVVDDVDGNHGAVKRTSGVRNL